MKKKITELEARVSSLYQIYNGEQFLDGIAAKTNLADKPCSPPASGPDEPWPALGTKPKRPSAASTSNGKWISTQDKKRKKRGRNSSRIASPPVPLGNRFAPLGTLQDEQLSTPKAKRHRSAIRAANEHKGPRSPTHHDGSYSNSTPTRPHLLHPGVPHSTPSPSRTTRGTIQPLQTTVPQDCPRLRYANTTSTSAEASHSPLALRGANAASSSLESIDAGAQIEANTASIGTEANHSPAREAIIANPNNPRTGPIATDKAIVGNANTTPQMAIIFVGIVMTEHVKLELSSEIQTILNNKPNNPKIIIHTGSFDILHKKTGSEILKKHFTQLLNTLNRYQDISISGPIACFRRGKEIFSRLLSFNTWLASVCLAHKRRFIDNFNVFWNCADRFKADGLHPNRRGSRLLTANISHALLTTSNSQNQASLPIPAVPKTDTSQTSSHGTEQNIQTASSKDTGPAQTLTTPGNSPVINHFELSDMDFQPEENQR